MLNKAQSYTFDPTRLFLFNLGDFLVICQVDGCMDPW